MQIDFHLGVTYVLSRLAGFTEHESNIIAGSSQYVDDAVNEGVIYFHNQAVYEFTSSAHRNLDYRNFKELSNHRVWIPFHFIPGLDVIEGDTVNVPEFVQKLVCRPFSRPAQDLVDKCIESSQLPMGLYFLGTTIHSLADTWAHQGFAGISHFVNDVGEIFDFNGFVDIKMKKHRSRYYLWQNLKKSIIRPIQRSFLKKWYEQFLSDLIGSVNPIGHGPVLSYPDLPFLIWSYEDWKGQTVYRNNPEDYASAVKAIFEVLARYKQKSNQHQNIFFDRDFEEIVKLLKSCQSDDPLVRLSQWEMAIKEGRFSFGTDMWSYQSQGQGSWLDQAFGCQDPDEFLGNNCEFSEAFLKQNWKLAQDALLYHRFILVYEILPNYGLCVA